MFRSSSVESEGRALRKLRGKVFERLDSEPRLRRFHTSLAARFELGLLAGRGIPTFVHVDPLALGRNYVWAAAKLHREVVSCRTLEEAVSMAVGHLRAG